MTEIFLINMLEEPIISSYDTKPKNIKAILCQSLFSDRVTEISADASVIAWRLYECQFRTPVKYIPQQSIYQPLFCPILSSMRRPQAADTSR